ncbi:MAG: glycosyltransferase family 39 protein [Verrucomicrobiia bacterium]
MNRQERMRIAIVLGAFAAAFLILTISSYTQTSATWDEPQHVTAGYMSLALNDYRTDPEHPPFLRMWAALPLLAMPTITATSGVIDQIAPPDWVGLGQFGFSHHFMYVANNADRMLYAARFMIVLLGILLGVLIFSWVREWLGLSPAIIALAFYSVEPNILAHSSLVTTDFGTTCFLFGTLYSLWRTTRTLTSGNLAGLVFFLALSVVSKFSALVLGPIILALLAIHVLRKTSWVCRIGKSGEIGSRMGKARVAAALVVLLALASWGMIWAVYGFRYAPSASATWQFHLENMPIVQQRTPTLARATHWIDLHRLLPNAYTEGFLLSQAKAQLRGAFLAGRYSSEGWRYYFPVAFLIKTPVSLIFLLLGGLVVCARRWKTFPQDEAFLLVPIVCYLVPAITARLNIGLRHILPIYPLVLLLAALAAAELLKSKERGARAVFIIACLFWLFEFARIYPHYLAFFNQLVGGPRNGYEYLADSNLDWGQDLKPLKRWMDNNNVQHINLAYFGTADPAYYGIQCTYLPGSPFFAGNLVRRPQLPGYVAVSATILDGVYLNDLEKAFYKPLLDREPNAVIGYSIRVYWVERDWW